MMGTVSKNISGDNSVMASKIRNIQHISGADLIAVYVYIAWRGKYPLLMVNAVLIVETKRVWNHNDSNNFCCKIRRRTANTIISYLLRSRLK